MSTQQGWSTSEQYLFIQLPMDLLVSQWWAFYYANALTFIWPIYAIYLFVEPDALTEEIRTDQPTDVQDQMFFPNAWKNWVKSTAAFTTLPVWWTTDLILDESLLEEKIDQLSIMNMFDESVLSMPIQMLLAAFLLPINNVSGGMFTVSIAPVVILLQFVLFFMEDDPFANTGCYAQGAVTYEGYCWSTCDKGGAVQYGDLCYETCTEVDAFLYEYNCYDTCQQAGLDAGLFLIGYGPECYTSCAAGGAIYYDGACYGSCQSGGAFNYQGVCYPSCIAAEAVAGYQLVHFDGYCSYSCEAMGAVEYNNVCYASCDDAGYGLLAEDGVCYELAIPTFETTYLGFINTNLETGYSYIDAENFSGQLLFSGWFNIFRVGVPSYDHLYLLWWMPGNGLGGYDCTWSTCNYYQALSVKDGNIFNGAWATAPEIDFQSSSQYWHLQFIEQGGKRYAMIKDQDQEYCATKYEGRCGFEDSPPICYENGSYSEKTLDMQPCNPSNSNQLWEIEPDGSQRTGQQ